MNITAEKYINLYQDFFNFLYEEHNLICTIEEMDEIIYETQVFIKKFNEYNGIHISKQTK